MFWKYLLLTETWKPIGCYQNRGRALGDILFKFKRFAKTSTKYEQCVTAASNQGAMLFGLEDTKCWTGENAAGSYDMYGLAKGKCETAKNGLRYGFMASETMFVYQNKAGKYLVYMPLWLLTYFSRCHRFTLLYKPAGQYFYGYVFLWVPATRQNNRSEWPSIPSKRNSGTPWSFILRNLKLLSSLTSISPIQSLVLDGISPRACLTFDLLYLY